MRGETARVEIRGETTGGKRLGGETSCDPTDCLKNGAQLQNVNKIAIFISIFSCAVGN